jgi:phosphatidylglycerophosphate synthase
MAIAQVRARFADRSIPGSGHTEALLAGAALLIGGTTALVIVGEPRWAGAAGAAAGVLLAVAGARVLRDRAPLDQFFDSVTDRAFDGCILSAIALVLREADLVTAAIAVAALVASFVAAYERARGRALGYPIEDSVVTRSLRYGLVSLGLLVPGWLRGTLIAVLALALLSCAVRASQVAKLERE